MKKHTYKAIQVTKVNWEPLANAVEGQRTITCRRNHPGDGVTRNTTEGF